MFEFSMKNGFLLVWILNLAGFTHVISRRLSSNQQLLKGPRSVLRFFFQISCALMLPFVVGDVLHYNHWADYFTLMAWCCSWITLQRGHLWVYLAVNYGFAVLHVHRSCLEDLDACSTSNSIGLPIVAFFYGLLAWDGFRWPLIMFALLWARCAVTFHRFGPAAFVGPACAGVDGPATRSDTRALGALVMLTTMIFAMTFFVARLGADLFNSTRAVLARYVSSAVAEELFDDPHRTLAIGGSRRRVTIMLSDLRGFSNLLATMTPENAVEIMNAYLQDMLEIIHQHDGTVDEIIGDALLVIFGLSQSSNHELSAQTAVRCAVDMQLAMEKHGRLAQGIGIHCGDVIVGNIGSRRRAKFGILGAAMNMAARVESFSLAGQIVVSNALIEQVGPSFAWRLGEERRVFPKGSSSTGIVIALVQAVDGRTVAGDHGLTKPIALRSAVSLPAQVLGGPAKSPIHSFDVRLTHADAAAQRLVARTADARHPVIALDADVRLSVANDEIIGKIVECSPEESELVLRLAVTFAGQRANEWLHRQLSCI